MSSGHCVNPHMSLHTVAKLVTLWPHSKKALGLIPRRGAPGPFYLDFSCYVHACMGLLWWLRFLPTSKQGLKQNIIISIPNHIIQTSTHHVNTSISLTKAFHVRMSPLFTWPKPKSFYLNTFTKAKHSVCKTVKR